MPYNNTLNLEYILSLMIDCTCLRDRLSAKADMLGESSMICMLKAEQSSVVSWQGALLVSSCY